MATKDNRNDKTPDRPPANQPNPALNQPAPAAKPPVQTPPPADGASHEVGAAPRTGSGVPGGQIPAPGELPSAHGNTPAPVHPAATQNPASGVFDADDAKRQTTVGQPVETKTGEHVPNPPPVGAAPAGGLVVPTVRPGDGLEPNAGMPPPGRAGDAPVPLSVLAVVEGEDVSVRDVVGLIRSVMESVRGGRFWEALDHVGDLLKVSRHVFDHGQHLVTSMDGRSRRDAFLEWKAFDEVMKDWGEMKARGFAAVAAGNAPPAASGSPMPTGGPIGVMLAPGDFAQIIGVVQTIIDLIRQLRSKRGG